MDDQKAQDGTPGDGPNTEPRGSAPAKKPDEARHLIEPKQAGERPVPLSPEQIVSANRIHAKLSQHLEGLRAINALAQRFPEFDANAVLLKIITINALHGPNVMSRPRVSAHIQKVMASVETETAGPELVEKLASVPSGPKEPANRRHYSFASKFAHFFLDPDRFPLMDNTTSRMVRFHLGPRSWIPDDEGHRYREFASNFLRLRGQAGFKGRKRELSRYLWIAGQYQTWLKTPKARINPELKTVFESPPADIVDDVRSLLIEVDTGTPWL